MANYIKKEIDTFEYNKKYHVPNEHRWCFMKDDDKFKSYYEKRSESLMPVIGRTQSDPEITGQVGNYM